ncbi:MAG TPA: hypothetical protein PL044_09370 [Clostridiales bacterium]|nr:hypothetical protein [Clostridiales bacterium]HQH64396.1 hypothetical protein [Clostridiales bacterium]HQK73962.1 hypothetical protein [Clostridiales bacterium]
MKKILALCIAAVVCAFSCTACIVINNGEKTTSAASGTTNDGSASTTLQETAVSETQTIAAGEDGSTTASSTTKGPAVNTTKPAVSVATTKPAVTVATTKPAVTVATTKPATTGSCKYWPVNNLTKLVPKPTFGEVLSSDLDGNEAHVFIKYDSHPANFNTYVSALKAAGYTNIQEDYSSSFKASNKDGVMVQFYPSKFPPLLNTYSVYVLEIKK